MIIDIILLVILLIAAVIGMRQGLITQICLFLAVVLTTIIAPIIAEPLGTLFTDSEILAYIAGFCIMLLVTVILVWVIAPIIKKHVLGDSLRKINAVVGAIVAVVTTLLIMSVACSALNTYNIGEVNHEKIGKLIAECDDKDELEDKFNKILDKDSEMRDYYEPRFIAYETLDDSFLFGAFVWVGETICPSLDEFREDMAVGLQSTVAESMTESITGDDGDEW